MISQERARRLLRNFRAKKARQPKYRDPVFVALFLEQCAAKLFEEPLDGVETAQLGLELAQRVAGPEHAELMVRALAVLASAYRRQRNFEAAEAAYDRAFKFCKGGGVGEIERARLMYCVAILKLSKARNIEALEFADNAVVILRDLKSQFLGEALVNRSQVHIHMGSIDAGISDLGEVLQNTNSRRAKVVYYCALHNLAYALTLANTLNAGKAFPFIRQARRQIRGHERSINRAKLRWVEGLAFRSLHMNARAEVLLDGAYRSLVDLAAYCDAARVAIDLVEIYLLEGRTSTAADLLCEALAGLREGSSTDTALALDKLIDSCRRQQTLPNLLAVREATEEIIFKLARHEVQDTKLWQLGIPANRLAPDLHPSG